MIITGELGRFKSPVLTICFGEHKFVAVIDTGAYDSHIDNTVINKLSLVVDRNTNTKMTQHPKAGYIQNPVFKLSFSIEGANSSIFEDTFNLMGTEYQYPVILGSNFLSRCKEFHYYGEQNKFELII
jgi:hypothetical protein